MGMLIRPISVHLPQKIGLVRETAFLVRETAFLVHETAFFVHESVILEETLGI